MRTVVDDSFEESGWTMYLEDFFAKDNKNNNDNDVNLDHQNCCFSFDDYETSSSLVSDAASLALKKNPDNCKYNCEQESVGLSLSIANKCYSKLSFKKRKSKGIANNSLVDDDALEDTASSPVNSPKVYDMMNQFNKSTKQRHNNMDISLSQAKGIISGIADDESRSDHLGFIGRERESTELRKRGLCLVPLSMVRDSKINLT
ncbi:hypothetical protein JCGZ_00831 [Jatropha curcas]|uniref:Uncharacterized protein n=2 Tax=Jatropha curcas TaxID=180498 RepID=A0A067L4Q9_JATCU|nr:hypothetical protein JCGZ_00831 [Jatropha curcas]